MVLFQEVLYFSDREYGMNSFRVLILSVSSLLGKAHVNVERLSHSRYTAIS